MSVSEVIWYAELVEQHILTRACIQLDYSHTAEWLCETIYSQPQSRSSNHVIVIRALV